VNLRINNKIYLALCHPSDIRDLSIEQLQYIPKVILLRMYDYIERLGQAFGIREGRFGDLNLSSLRALQSAVAANAHRRPRTKIKTAVKVGVARRSAK